MKPTRVNVATEFPKLEVTEWTESKHTVIFKFLADSQRPETFSEVVDMVRLSQKSSVETTHTVVSTHHYSARIKE